MAGDFWSTGNNPYLPIGYFQNMADPSQQGRDWLTRYAKGGLKRMARGDDVSSFGEFNVLNQAEDVARQQAREEGGTGENRLMTAQGGEQLQRGFTDKALNQINAQAGMSRVNAMLGLQNQWQNQLRQGQQMEQQQNQWANNLYLQALGMKYPMAFQPYYQGIGDYAAKAGIGAALGSGQKIAGDYGWG